MSISPETILREMAAQWESGSRTSVEKILVQYPDLNNDTQVLLDLIQNEVILREGLKETPTLQEYIKRFPNREKELRIQWEIDSAIRSMMTDQARSIHTDLYIPQNIVSTSDFDVPRQLQLYQIVRLIGRGGMGVVYLAHDTQLNRPVAIKLLREVAPSPKILARFRQEGESASRLHHPNIVQVYQVGQEKNQPYLVFEYVEGISLADSLKTLKKADNPPSHKSVARLVEQLARAMDYAHQRGVLHRDIKPGNILIAREGEELKQILSIPETLEKGTPKVADFGLARQIDSENDLTQTGQIMGTPSYMAPEQADGKTTGTFTDIYALGATLYQCLTLNLPYSGSTTEAVLRKVRSESPEKPSRYRPIPLDLETICLKCLEREPQNRYSSAGALADDLANYLAGRPIQARPVGPLQTLWRWSKRNPSLAFVTLFAILIFLGGSITSTVFAVMESKRSNDLKTALDQKEKVTQQVIIEKNTIVERDSQLSKRLAENLFIEAWSAQHLERNPIRAYHRLSEALDIEHDDDALRESIGLFRSAVEMNMPHLRGVAPFPENAIIITKDWSLQGNRVAIIWQGQQSTRGVMLLDTPSLQNQIHLDWVQNPRAVVLNSQGTLFAVVTSTSELFLGDAKTGKKLATFPAPKGINSCLFHPLEDQLLVWTPAELTLYDCKTTQILRTMKQSRGVIFPAFVNEGKQIVATSKEKLHVWQTDTGNGVSMSMFVNLGGLFTITHPMRKEILLGRRSGTDANRLFTGYRLYSDREINPEQLEQITFPLGLDPQSMTETGLIRVIQDATDTAELWTLNRTSEFIESLGKVSFSAYHTDGRIWIDSAQNRLICWQIPEDNIGKPFEMDLQVPGAFHPNGKNYLCRVGRKLYFWNAVKGQLDQVVELPSDRAIFRWSPQRNTVCFIPTDLSNGSCKIFQANQPDREIRAQAGSWIAFSFDGQRALIPEALGNVMQNMYRYHVWDLNNLTRSQESWEGPSHVNSFFSEDGKTLWLLKDVEKRTWVTRHSQTLKETLVTGSDTNNQYLSHDGRFRIVRESRGPNRIYSITDETLLGELKGEDVGVFHPKYPYVIYRDTRSKKVEIQNYASGKLVGKILNNVASPPFYSVDGRFLIVRTTNQQAEVYEARTGRLLLRWSIPGLTEIQIDANSTQLALITGTKTTFKKLPQFVATPTQSYLQEARTRTGYELLPSGEVAPLPLDVWQNEAR